MRLSHFILTDLYGRAFYFISGPQEFMINGTLGRESHLLRSSFFSSVLGFAFLTLTAISVQGAVDILDVRTGIHPNKTRVVVDISEPVSYQISYRDTLASDGLREIIIDLKEATNRDDITALVQKIAQIGVVEKIKLENKAGSVRLRLTLNEPATVDNSFLLAPEPGNLYRLVIDMKPITSAQWSEQVPLPTPPPVEPEITEIALPEAPVAAIVPAETAPSQPDLPHETPSDLAEVESYDDMVTEDSNFTLSGYIEVEGRLFTQSSPQVEPKDWTLSFAVEPLLEYISEDGNTQFMFRPFARVDVQDKDRSHVDIRELKGTFTRDQWQLTVGIDTLFWGVTESNHLVEKVPLPR